MNEASKHKHRKKLSITRAFYVFYHCLQLAIFFLRKIMAKKAQSSLAEFGTRKLEDESLVFQENAWDNVELDDEMLEIANISIEAQKRSPFPAEKVIELDNNPEKHWDKFYSNNTNRFFKDRNWLQLEFPELFAATIAMEIGCGAGNTVFPFIKQKENVFVYACDYSSEAVQVVKSNPLYDQSRIHAFVYDITNPSIPDEIPLGTIDVCVCIFILSAVNPRDWKTVSSNIFKLLKPGGLVLIRDYGRYDLAQTRFKSGRYLQDNFYRRGDNTRVYFFTNEELGGIFSQYECVMNAADKRLIVNRQKKLKMYRCWLQAKFRKPVE